MDDKEVGRGDDGRESHLAQLVTHDCLEQLHQLVDELVQREEHIAVRACTTITLVPSAHDSRVHRPAGDPHGPTFECKNTALNYQEAAPRIASAQTWPATAQWPRTVTQEGGGKEGAPHQRTSL